MLVFKNSIEIAYASESAGIADLDYRSVCARDEIGSVVEAKLVYVVGKCDAAIFLDASCKMFACFSR